MKFSQRYNKIEIIFAKDGISDKLQKRIWNTIDFHISSYYQPIGSFESIIDLIYDKCFGEPINDLAQYNIAHRLTILTTNFLKFDWLEVFDFIENVFEINNFKGAKELENNLNQVFLDDNSAYRIVNYVIVEITSKEEIIEIQEALETGFEGVKIHLSQAISILSNRDKPDYRNVIKESISAVESICQVITGDKKATLGKALNKIEKDYKIHNDLKDGFKKIYWYTSDSDGIRHSLTEEPKNLTLTDAKFMLIACSAFVNYLIGKISELGIEIENYKK
ncbi:MAG: hypothetical protein GWP19_09050 [Planctomycetia bacterium]|nr:hypothetical protein [Planctomycetia bacterium]